MKALGKSPMYDSMKEILNPGHTALVIWDIHTDFVNTTFNKEEFLLSLKSIIKAARANNVPIIYARIAPLPRDYESPWRIYMQMKRDGVDDPEKLLPFMQPGSPEAEIYSELSPTDGDAIIDHYTLSIFIGTHFEYMMRNRGISTILFTGLRTEIGIDSSARDAVNRDFCTVVVEDCVSTINEELHESALRTLRRVCLVVPSRDIIKEWK